MPSTANYQYDPCGRLTSVTWDDGSMVIYTWDACGNRLMTYTIAPTGGDCTLNVVTKTADFTADEAHTYYLIDGDSGDINVTMPASLDLGYGSLQKFKVVSGRAIFAFDGSETFGHASGDRDQELELYTYSGVLESVAVELGYDET